LHILKLKDQEDQSPILFFNKNESDLRQKQYKIYINCLDILDIKKASECYCGIVPILYGNAANITYQLVLVRNPNVGWNRDETMKEQS
jgi:hypothetical protein